MKAMRLPISETEMLRHARAERAKRDFRYFVRLMRPEFEVQWFHDTMIDEMVRAGTASEDTRLGIAVPPGHGKSEYAWLYVAWMVTRDPNVQIKYITYSIDFGRQQFKRLKLLLNSDRYIHYFGRKINTKRVVNDERSSYVNSAEMFEVVGGTGWVHATGFGGQITGSRCDIIVIDDPFKRDEVHSQVVRERKWGIYLDEISTRARPYRPLRILMIFTRWHLDDLAGRAKERQPDAWRWVEIEALRMSALDSQRSTPIDDPREDGEALWDAVADAAQLRAVQDVSESSFWSLYQQTPQPPGGSLFRLRWFGEWERIDVRPGRWLQSWDLRHGGAKDAGSYAVGLLAWIYDDTPDETHIVSCKRGRWSPEETLRIFEEAQQHKLWSRAGEIIVEKKGDGVMICSYAQGRHPVVPVSPRGSKVQRARAVVPWVAKGCVLLPVAELLDDEPWVEEFRRELTLFSDLGSGTGQDDQVDALTQLLDHIYDITTNTPEPSRKAEHTWALMMGQSDTEASHARQ